MSTKIEQVLERAEAVRRLVGTDDPGPDTDDPDEIGVYWLVRYFESRGCTFYSAAHSAKPEVAKLAERGWFRKWRVPNLIDPNGRPPMPTLDPLWRNPVARVARRVYLGGALAMTPGEILQEAGREANGPRYYVDKPPADAKELHDHLVKIAPALQTRCMLVDEERIYRMDDYVRRAGYVKTEYWESEKTGETLWAFAGFRSRRPENERQFAQGAWEKARVLEKVVDYYAPPWDFEITSNGINMIIDEEIYGEKVPEAVRRLVSLL
jgi:hypothetical protein